MESNGVSFGERVYDTAPVVTLSPVAGTNNGYNFTVEKVQFMFKSFTHDIVNVSGRL